MSSVPEETAEAVVTELSRRTNSDFVSVAQVTADRRMQELATFNRIDGVRRGGDTFPTDLAAYLLGRARSGPWVDEVRAVGPAEPTDSLRKANLDMVASAPIFAGDDLVGLLSIGTVADDSRSSRARQAKLLAAAIDYAERPERHGRPGHRRQTRGRRPADTSGTSARRTASSTRSSNRSWTWRR